MKVFESTAIIFSMSRQVLNLHDEVHAVGLSHVSFLCAYVRDQSQVYIKVAMVHCISRTDTVDYIITTAGYEPEESAGLSNTAQHMTTPSPTNEGKWKGRRFSSHQ